MKNFDTISGDYLAIAARAAEMAGYRWPDMTGNQRAKIFDGIEPAVQQIKAGHAGQTAIECAIHQAIGEWRTAGEHGPVMGPEALKKGRITRLLDEAPAKLG